MMRMLILMMIVLMMMLIVLLMMMMMMIMCFAKFKNACFDCQLPYPYALNYYSMMY